MRLAVKGLEVKRLKVLLELRKDDKTFLEILGAIETVYGGFEGKGYWERFCQLRIFLQDFSKTFIIELVEFHKEEHLTEIGEKTIFELLFYLVVFGVC